MILATMPGLLVRGVLFALLAASLLVNPGAAPAAYFEDDAPAPIEEADGDAAGIDEMGPKEDVGMRDGGAESEQSAGGP